MHPERLANGRYALLEVVREDATTQVYRAQDHREGVERVVTLYAPESAAVRQQVREDCRVLQGLGGHRHVVPVLDVGEAYGGVFVVTPPMPGGSVEDHMLQLGPLPPAQAAAVASAVLRALEVAHALGVAHRGLGPENVRIDGDGIIRVDGFAEALVTGRAEAPEQAGQPGEGDARSDIYAVGAMLVSMLGGTGRREIPAVLDGFVRRCMHDDPAHRFPTAADARAALDALQLPSLPPGTPALGDATRAPAPSPAPSSFGEFLRPNEEIDWDDVDPEAKTVLDANRRTLLDGPTEPTRTTESFAEVADALFGPAAVVDGAETPAPLALPKPEPPRAPVSAPIAAPVAADEPTPAWVWVAVGVGFVIVVAGGVVAWLKLG